MTIKLTNEENYQESFVHKINFVWIAEILNAEVAMKNSLMIAIYCKLTNEY